MFTIEVRKKSKDEEFSFKDLEMFHRECIGGRIKITEDSLFIRLICLRCKTEKILLRDANPSTELIQTVIDGKERKIDYDICVVQRD